MIKFIIYVLIYTILGMIFYEILMLLCNKFSNFIEDDDIEVCKKGRTILTFLWPIMFLWCMYNYISRR